jgi:hypothetical protein
VTEEDETDGGGGLTVGRSSTRCRYFLTKFSNSRFRFCSTVSFGWWREGESKGWWDEEEELQEGRTQRKIRKESKKETKEKKPGVLFF